MKKQAVFRFYEELNDFLPLHKRKTDFVCEFDGSPSIKDTIESFGIPHPEVDLILVNGQSVNFSYLLQDGDRVSVYPLFESFDISNATHLREKPLRNPRFLLDVHLGRLARFLRLLGFDSLYENTFSDRDIADTLPRDPGRILLTRDRELLKKKVVTHGYWVRATEKEQQVKEVLRRFDLFALISPFTVCLACNGRIAPVEKEAMIDLLPPKVRERFESYTWCPACRRIYWQGTHYEKMQNFIHRIVEE